MTAIENENQKNFLTLFRDPVFVNLDERKEHSPRHTTDLHAAMALNNEGQRWGVYFTVNGFADFVTNPSRKIEFATSLNAHFVEIDDPEKSPQETAAEAILLAEQHGIPFSALVLTGRGVHCYWLFDEPLMRPTQEQKDAYTRIQDALTEMFRGDKQARDIARVLRVPKSKYWKDGSGKEIELATLAEYRYTEDDFLKLFPAQAIFDQKKRYTPMSEVMRARQGERNGKAYTLALKLCNQFKEPSMRNDAHAAYRSIIDTNFEKVAGDDFHIVGREADRQFEAAWQKVQLNPGWTAQKNITVSASGKSKPVFTCFADIAAEQVQWLWPGRIALGKLTLFVGDPSVGKSLLTATMAAIVSKGASWPVDCTPSPIGDVVLLSAEDDAADTIKPRLEAAGADSKRVHTLQAIREKGEDGKQKERLFSLQGDIEALEEMLAAIPECKLIVVDPVSAYLGDTESHNNAAIRGLLYPLAVLAAKHKVALVAINHFNKNSKEKNSLYRPAGSLAFVAAARSAYVVARDTEDQNRRLVIPLKNNLAKETTGLAYTIVSDENDAPIIVWEPDPVDVTASEALSEPDTNAKRSDTEWAILFLQDLLSAGPIEAAQVQKEARKAGINDKPLRTAREKLKIKPQKSSFQGPWMWALPHHEDAQQDEDAPSENKGRLEDGGHLGETPQHEENTPSSPYRYVTTVSELEEALPSFVSADKIGLDIETTGLDPLSDKVRLVQLATDTDVLIVDVNHVDITALQAVFDSETVFIGHNLKFDLRFLMHAGIMPGKNVTFFDTLLADQVLRGSRSPRALKAVVGHYLGEIIDKTQQAAEWGDAVTPEMLAYAARDAAILLPLHDRISTLLAKDSLAEVVALENEALPFVVHMELAGVSVYANKWRELTEAARIECSNLEAELNHAAGRTVNWRSPKQIITVLKEQGVAVKSTSEDVLSAYSDHELVSVLLKYREQSKYVSTYGEKFLQHIHESTGRIHPDFRQIGADSGRMACSSPNMQNIPRNRDYRACVAPMDGKVLVKADYSQVELRIAAEISGDARLIEAYQAGEDIHSLTARLILGKETPTKEDRQAAKAINFGLLYGMGAPRLKEYAKNTYGVILTDEEALTFRSKFFATYQGLRKWHRAQPDGVRTVKTLAGRKRFEVERFTEKLNTPVQGTGADGLKAALGILWKEREKFPTARPVLVVHDEIVMECDATDAERVAAWLEDCMKRGMERYVKSLPVGVEVTIAETWAK